MADESVNSLSESLSLYRSQLSDVASALSADESNADLIALQADLNELVALTEDKLMKMLKSDIETASVDVIKDTVTDDYLSSAGILADAQADDFHDDTAETNAVSHILNGRRCRAPYMLPGGSSQLANAMIYHVDCDNKEDTKLHVLFTHPTSLDMKPCEHFLEGKCTFDETCKFSHGAVVDLEHIEPFIEPDFASLATDSECFAKCSDGLWRRAVVSEITETGVSVSVTSIGEVMLLDFSDILPLIESSDTHAIANSILNSDSESDSDHNEDSNSSDNVRTGRFCASSHSWEIHTKGIGSKLLSKMGYVPGMGLGKSLQGRAEPVPYDILPKLKSLDTVMEARKAGGDLDPIKILKNEKKLRKSQLKRDKKAYERNEKKDVFDFMNDKLGKSKHKQSSTVRSASNSNNKLSDKDINVQLIKVDEQILGLQHKIFQANESLERNMGKDKFAAEKASEKLQGLHSQLKDLLHTKKLTENQQKRRVAKRKLTEF